MKKIVTVSMDLDELEYIDVKLADFKKVITEYVDKVPAEFRDTITLSTEHEEDYGCHRSFLSMRYQRPETDEEYNARTKQELAIEQREFAEYERLRKKFERGNK